MSDYATVLKLCIGSFVPQYIRVPMKKKIWWKKLIWVGQKVKIIEEIVIGVRIIVWSPN